MSIRFRCPACGQPIEVDNTDANSQVVCFYCRAVVDAPAQSDPALAQQGQIGVSSPVGAELRHVSEVSAHEVPAAGQELGPAGPGRGKGIKLGTIGFLAALAATVILAASILWAMGKMMPLWRTPGFKELDFNQQYEQIEKEIMAHTEKSPMFGLASLAALVLALVGFGFSVAGIVKKSARVLATAGLIISGSLLLCQCAGMIVRLASSAVPSLAG